MREQNIEVIRKACVAANPEIMELKFGCELLRSGETKYQVINPLGWGANNKKCWLNSVPFGDIPIELEKDLVQHGGEFAIVGRPIRLADVLLAIEAKGYYPEREEDAWNVVCKYNLRKDSLTDQSDECLTFLANLLK